MSEIRVCLFDDSPSIRQAMGMLFQASPGYTLTGAYENALWAVERVEADEPDVILMDIDMPGKNGIQGLESLRKMFPNLPVIMLTVFDDEERIFRALRAGANGYLLKQVSPPDLLSAIKEVSQGGAPMTPSIAQKVLAYFHSPPLQNQSKQYRLTNREQEVLVCLVAGLSYKETGSKLFISFETVRSHIRKIYEKLHVSSLTEAVAKAIREGLVE